MKKYVGLVVVLLVFMAGDVVRPGDVVSRACPRRVKRTQVRQVEAPTAQEAVSVSKKSPLRVARRHKINIKKSSRSGSPATSTDASVDDEDVPLAPASFEGYAHNIEQFEVQLKKNNTMTREEQLENSRQLRSLCNAVDAHIAVGKPENFNYFATSVDHKNMYLHALQTQTLKISLNQCLLKSLTTLEQWNRLQESILATEQEKERLEQKVMQFDDYR